ILGFPPDFKSKKKGQGVDSRAYATVAEGGITKGSNSNHQKGQHLTKEHYNQFMDKADAYMNK
ncbi:hypothetical protein HAX54_016560, partial [Datura stramonium]|nr:hypothetical protein [Datura stramonium]